MSDDGPLRFTVFSRESSCIVTALLLPANPFEGVNTPPLIRVGAGDLGAPKVAKRPLYEVGISYGIHSFEIQQ